MHIRTAGFILIGMGVACWCVGFACSLDANAD